MSVHGAHLTRGSHDISSRSTREEQEWLRVLLLSIGDAVLATDEQGRVKLMNPVAERLTGMREAEAQGRPLGEVFRIVNEETREPALDPVTTVLGKGVTVHLANHTVLIAKEERRLVGRATEPKQQLT